MARGGRYSSIPLILICTRQLKKGKYIPTDTVDYRKMSERMPRPLKSILPKQDKDSGECVFQLFRSISAGRMLLRMKWTVTKKSPRGQKKEKMYVQKLFYGTGRKNTDS